MPITLKSASFDDYKPNPGRSREFFTIKSDKYTKNETFAIKIRAIDFNNNAGPWSSVLIVKLKPTVVFSHNLRNITEEDLISKQKLKNSVEPKEGFYNKFLIGFASKSIFFLKSKNEQITLSILYLILKYV